MNIKKMKRLNIIVGLIMIFVLFLGLFLIIEYSTLSDDLKFILLFSFCFLIILFLSLYEISFCRKGIKKFDSSLIDKNIKKRLMNYFLKENFIRDKYNDDIVFYVNKERNNMIFRSYVADLKIDNKNEMDIKLIELFDKIIDEASVTKKDDKTDLYFRSFVFLITDKYDEEKFAFLDKYTFINAYSWKGWYSDDLGSFVIPIVLCTEDHCIYFTNPSRYPFFFEERKLDVLKLFEIEPDKNEKN